MNVKNRSLSTYRALKIKMGEPTTPAIKHKNNQKVCESLKASAELFSMHLLFLRLHK
jgi:hypothetical protein